ncbi:orotate phosphoribosyltransferase [Bartonella bacilliformis str. Heidi Mejia]|uniref:Orotate phosphoribosyltransferase n=2 Tax=Bartonella bacilliformis TaxID=774 RepID=PYRE_BARBK|nr:orotate phosphoribosyltransferase [Bartonella bacilliformis]A1US32.1 RecName: Full=Orotate phosphoribosyltransferase; Short=OPRT; Short=OPRTase [Bartonella bacilliformis KC583]ABM44994.1 orotate phosphoribosyltransferase [Bartonella bacilliformis KC583]AMG85618.1 orotate phosphoribosyltransferase [Bartonella bacilliformis]EKS45034.1 orotate phosphoribosyltransferase [Bartonella bacilliformis INS]EYS90087.1 orotate phosphoribosyltransferase [Bartonella bacilliformis San Pedro600-02]EYS92250
MNTQDVINIFKQADAILEGHFILTSGRHSATFLQKAKVFMHADLTEKLCRGLAQEIKRHVEGKIDYVVGPAIGGLIPSYETSRHLGVPSIWVERENGVFRLRRFEVEKGARVVIVEDIVTTGLSIRETIEALVAVEADVVASACIIDRSGGKVDVGVPLIALAEYEIVSYTRDTLPHELSKIPAVKPGSRDI